MACLCRGVARARGFLRAAKPIDSSAALGYHWRMFRILLFLLSLLVTAGGFAQAVVDGTVSIGADSIVLTSFAKLVELASPGVVERCHGWVNMAAPVLWDSGVRYVFVAPAFVVLWALGFVFYIMSTKRAAQIGTSNRDR